MLVSQYFNEFIQDKPYKYQTKKNMIHCLKKLELWDMEYEEITANFCWNRIEAILNQNVKRTYSGYLRNIFDFSFKQMPVVDGIPKTYNFPPQEVMHEIIESTKYRRILYLCMYAGLRIGEACAVVPAQIKREENQYWINVDRAFSQDGVSLGSPKTLGKVMIPEWLALEVLEMKKEEYWVKGMPTKRVTTACQSLGHTQKASINPHMLRHWFATDMVRRNVPANVIMRQMRHRNINTTMRIYAQVHNDDFVNALPIRPEDKVVKLAKVVNLFS